MTISNLHYIKLKVSRLQIKVSPAGGDLEGARGYLKRAMLRLLLLLLPFTFCLSPQKTKAQTRVTDTLKNSGTLGQYYNYNNGGVILGNGFTAVPGSGQSFHAYITSTECLPLSLGIGAGQNYILTSVPRAAGIKDASQIAGHAACQLMQTVQYIDGLGRPIQTVQVAGSANGLDMVQPFAYDAFGREAAKYQPYAANTFNGDYKPNALASSLDSFYNTPPVGVKANSYPLAGTGFEASPLNRVVEQGAPGSVWQLGSGHTVKIAYQTNDQTTAFDSTVLTSNPGSRIVALYTAIINSNQSRTLVRAGNNATYTPGQLYLTITKDENWNAATDGCLHTTEEYKDKEGHIVLKRTYNKTAAAVKMLSTYYIYDDFGSLTYVLPPGAAPDANAAITQTTLNNFAYQYRYDERNRPTQKKLPGKGWDFMVYNKLDQIVATQDSNRRVNSQWIFSKYDGQGRAIQTGIWASSADRTSLQGTIDGITINLWETAQNSGNGYTNLAFPTSSVTTTLSLNYYDGYGLIPGLPSLYSAPTGVSTMTTGLLTASLTNVLGSTDMLWKVNYYDDRGRDTVTYAQHYLGGVANTNNYDKVAISYNFTNQDSTTTRQHYVNSSGTPGLAVTIVNNFIYDHVGRKLQTLESINGTTPVVLSQTDYNEVGQAMNKHLGNDVQKVAYAYNERGWLTQSTAPLFTMSLNYNDGTIPQYNGNIANQTWSSAGSSGNYTYRYDAMNRLLSGIASTGNTEKSIAYDNMGNITGLQRYLAGTVVDELKYNYTLSGNPTNQLQTITDSTANNAGLKHGTFTYAYDGNGNMITDNSKGLSITYNILNLPNVNTLTGGTVTYTYDANGNKLRKVNTIGTTETTDYVSGIQYTNGAIDFIQTEEGRALNTSGTYSYEYNLADHLGDTRLSFNNTGSIIQQDDYLPFGYDINVSSIGVLKNNYLYNKKELQAGLGLYDYGARLYDPVVARWTSVDPLAEKGRRETPYGYAFDDPMRFTDPDGMWPDWLDNAIASVKSWASTPLTQSQQKTSTAWSVSNTQSKTKGESLMQALTMGMVEAVPGTTPGSLRIPGKALASAAPETPEVTEVPSLGARAKEIHSAVPKATQNRTTIAVGEGTDADGNTVRIVGSSEKKLRPAQRAVLNTNEVQATGSGHAETTVLNYASDNGIDLSTIGASRPICNNCYLNIQQSGTTPVTPIKKPVVK